ncbi:protease complex subunit PrcB family protein [uncultured Flavobacterium sp.]|uniref:protease complex subunit PrcB family protein n=1 Tax=uncultured Flavobacterium sp. TaxID=165435 RepID=UPI0025E99A75|nr:protease complex subunit PrcB family protein [uncultured Flavobacterium sp.]
MKRIILAAAMAVSLYSCQDDDSGPIATTNNGPVAVTFTEIGNQELMGSENFEVPRLVIDNEADWNALKAQMDLYNPYSAGFTENDIDFSQYKVIAVIDELRTSGGYDITIASVSRDREQITVHIEHSDSGPGNAASVLTQPFHIVKIPYSPLPVVFE